MRVLLLGSGGREHALAWKISKSPLLKQLVCAPGNPGIAAIATCEVVKADDPREIVNLAHRYSIDLVVVGPEAPLVAGVADALHTAGVRVFGPVAAAANIEGSKAFAKEVMIAAGVPTAECAIFDSPIEAEAHARAHGRVVVKADGLAAGKGVVVAHGADEAVAAVQGLAAFGVAGKRIVLEELLEGEEVSVIALCDGERYVLLPSAQDHKRAFDLDAGPNTGGMGAYAPAPFLDGPALLHIGEQIIAPTLKELQRRGLTFQGALYAGLMLTREGPKVLEFNCRLGDPETQVLMMQIDEDLLPLLYACACGTLQARAIRQRNGSSIGVVLASEGYPQSPKLGDTIDGLKSGELPDVEVFHAGTRWEGSKLVTAGGRVLTVCAHGARIDEARERVYEAVSRIRFRGMHHRRDIGARAMRLA